jgi:hypothetical protein
MNKTLNTIIIATSALTFLACGSGGGGDSSPDGSSSNSVKLSGVLPLDSANLSPSRKAISNIGDIEQIVAIAKQNNAFQVSQDVQNDGGFSVDLETEYDYTVIAANPDAENLEDKFIGFVPITENAEQELIDIPIQNAIDDIDLGNFTSNGDSLVSGNTISDVSSSFDLNQDTLLKLTGLGNLEKMIQNSYLASHSVWETPHLQYTLDNNVSTNVGANTFSVVEGFLQYTPYFYINNETLTQEEFNALNSTNLKLLAPNGDEINYTLNGDVQNTYFNTMISYNFSSENDSEDYFDGTNIKNGYFKIVENNVTTSVFDLSLGKLQDENGNFTVILPSVRIDVDANDTVTGFTLNWYQYNPASAQYEKITDLAVLQELSEKTNTYSNLSALRTDSDGNINNDELFDTKEFVFNNSADIKAEIGIEDLPFSLSSRDADTHTFQHLSVHLYFGDVLISYQLSYDL